MCGIYPAAAFEYYQTGSKRFSNTLPDYRRMGQPDRFGVVETGAGAGFCGLLYIAASDGSVERRGSLRAAANGGGLTADQNKVLEDLRAPDELAADFDLIFGENTYSKYFSSLAYTLQQESVTVGQF